MKQNNIILVGAFHEIIELCEKCNKNIIGIIDNNIVKNYCGYKIIGSDENAMKIYNNYSNIPIVISPDNPLIRQNLVNYYQNIGFKFSSLIHPTANISRFTEIGKGCIIQYGANISANVIISDFVKVNTYSNIMHDCKIGKFTTIAPNTVILGYVEIGTICYIGSNATILPYKKIENNVIVGAGAVVTKDIKYLSKVVGNPANEF